MMGKIAFYLGVPFILLISILPIPALYGISSYFIFPLLFYVLKYRRKVVYGNLERSFPEKTKEELLLIERNFYKYLGDLFVETLKSFTISEKEIKSKVAFEDIDILEKLYSQQKSVVITCGHLGNYEWLALAASFYLKHKVIAPYRKMTNPKFDRFFRKSRMRFGALLFPSYETFEQIKKHNNETVILALANDQSAPPNKSFWTRFLNQDTSFFIGTEKIAIENDFAVVFAHFTVPKRGHYLVKFEKITENAPQEAEGFILNKHAELLEKDIISTPQIWLWSHKRWKHAKPKGINYGFNLVQN